MPHDPNDPGASAPPSPGIEGRVVAERYRIERLLGEGGMGAVYRAQHIHMRKTVAIKVLHAEMTNVAEVVARFEREAVAAGRIQHPNVAVATDFGRLEDGAFFLVLEYAEGVSLRDLLAQIGPLPPDRSVRIARQVASALGAAHALNIVHRDLKPENVMLIARDGEPDFVKVLDFGIAKMTLDDTKDQPALTRIGAVFGTPHYMSPEQALGQTVDHRSDLYALGILLFEMLSGAPPFDDDDATMVLANQITAPPPPLPDAVPPLLKDLVLRLLEKEPQGRPQSAAEVVAALDGALAPSSTLDITPSPPSSALVASTPASQLSPTLHVLPESRASAHSLPGPFAPVPVVTSAPVVRTTMHDVVRVTMDSIDRIAPTLNKPVTVGSATFPTWLPIAGGAGLFTLLLTVIVGTALVASSGSGPVAIATSGVIPRPTLTPKAPPAAPPEPSADAVTRIESVAVYKRSLDDWITLAHAYATLGRHKESAVAYRSVLQLDSSRRHDPVVLADLRAAARDPNAYDLVINLAEGRRSGLGQTGVDLIWDIWTDQRKQGDARSEDTFKKLVVLSRRGSKAVRVAIELNATNRCEKLDAALDRASKYADRRASPRLEQVAGKTDCSSEGCFPCLRGSPKLTAAIARAGSTPPPSIEKGYR